MQTMKAPAAFSRAAARPCIRASRAAARRAVRVSASAATQEARDFKTMRDGIKVRAAGTIPCVPDRPALLPPSRSRPEPRKSLLE
jgi:hypothetical protein